MSVTIRPDQLRYQMARRGLTASNLAGTARISAATVSAALAGRAISATSLSLIAQALADTPLIAGIDVLLALDAQATQTTQELL